MVGMSLGKRLEYIEQTWPGPNVYWRSVWMALRLLGYDPMHVGVEIGVDHRVLNERQWAQVIGSQTTPWEKYLPWYAAKIAGIVKQFDKGSTPSSEALARIDELADGFPAIVSWALAKKPNLGPMSFAQAMREQISWHEDLARGGGRKLGRGDQGEAVWSGGGWTVQRLGPHQLRREGEAMGHCAGGLDYKHRVFTKKIAVYSLRDPKGQPHATVSANLTGDGLWAGLDEAQGRGNAPLADKYRRRLAKWLDAAGVPASLRGHLALDRLDQIPVPKGGGVEYSDSLVAFPMIAQTDVALNSNQAVVTVWAALTDEGYAAFMQGIAMTLFERLKRDPRMRAQAKRLDLQGELFGDRPRMVRSQADWIGATLVKHVLGRLQRGVIDKTGQGDPGDNVEFGLEFEEIYRTPVARRAALGPQALQTLRRWHKAVHDVRADMEREVAQGAPWLQRMDREIFAHLDAL